MEILEEKAGQYVEKELITRAKADSILEIILGERGQGPEANPLGGADDEDGNATRGTRKLSLPEMAALLAKREGQMQEGGTDEHPTDQSDISRELSFVTPGTLEPPPSIRFAHALRNSCSLRRVAGLQTHRSKVSS